MERYFGSSKRVKAAFSPINVYAKVELVVDGGDHECARTGTTGIVIAKHEGVADRKFFVRLHCGHNCVCVMTREQIRLADQDLPYWN